jgi:enamine deaminase RidA (YjgF/YER057c/UK114 family)
VEGVGVTAPAPVGVYEPYAIGGQLLALSAISSARDGQMTIGKVGAEIDLATARVAAERAAENLIAVLLHAVGDDTSRIARVLMVRGYVNATPDFVLTQKVIDAASDRIIARFGEKGRHARTSIGCSTLPNGNAVTLEALVILA